MSVAFSTLAVGQKFILLAAVSVATAANQAFTFIKTSTNTTNNAINFVTGNATTVNATDSIVPIAIGSCSG